MSAPPTSSSRARSACRWSSTSSRTASSRPSSSAAWRIETPIEQVVVNGLILGMNYALIALGITLIFAIMGVLNFAHGQMYVLGGFVTYYVYGVFGLNYFVALAASAVTVACVGLVFERFLFRRVLRITTREESTMLLAAGTALLLDSLGLALFGEKQRGVAPVVAGVYEIFGAFVPASRALIFVLAGGLVGALLLFIQYTRPGRALRAIAQDKETAALQGVDIDRYSALGFALGAALAGLAGGLLVTVFAVNAGAGTPISIKAFIMIMIGGAGVVSGAILGAFALVGGYTTAILSVKLGVSFWLCLPASGLAAALVGAVIGWPILRLKGVYFAMITLTLSEAARLAALNGGTITQGATGILNIPLPGEVTFAGVVLVPAFRALNVHLAFYYLAAILLVLGLFTVTRIASCRLGWIFRSLRQDEALAASIGVNVAKYRVLAFALGCFFAGIAGAFFTVSQQSIYPSSFGVPDSVYFMLYCFLGGLSYVSGPVVGAFVLFLGFELLHGLREYEMLTYAAIMIRVMLWLPNGIVR